MNKTKMFAMNSPELEIQVELMLLAQNRPESVEKLVSAGWGIYPQVLNALVALGYTQYVHLILQAAGEYEKYPVNEMQEWMEAYYEKNWKFQVKEFGFQKIAEAFFSYAECDEAGFANAIVGKNERGSWAILADDIHGIENIKHIYVCWNNELNQGSSTKEKERVADLERFLLSRGEYAFLYERQCWRTLSLSLEGCKYIAETKHYMNGLANCLLDYGSRMDEKTRSYCIEKLDNAGLDDNYGPRYQEWKKRQAH